MSDNKHLPIEKHPLKPFLPENAKILLLGSFPPQPHRWSMNFFYPNFINDMWRIMGVIFFNNKDRFVDNIHKSFKQKEIETFCKEKGIAIFDTATSIRRLKDNASDKFLEVVEATNIEALLTSIPDCNAIVTTGEKATETLSLLFNCETPKIGHYTTTLFNGKELKIYRMPSSSRAYPLALPKKAEIYRTMLIQTEVLHE
ncbi:MAG: uracil-DNA glycosylase family protein [Bacteroidales bacterium]